MAVQPIAREVPAVMPPELAAALFEQESQRIVGMPGREFLTRWDEGEFRDFDDTPDGRELSYLILLIPFGRQDT